MITYLEGDATKPIGKGMKFIVHVCNDLGAWGAGFVIALSKQWYKPELKYRSLTHKQLKLGSVQFATVEWDIVVCNMIAQHGVGFDKKTKLPPIRYDALRSCLKNVNEMAETSEATIHAPRFGAGLSGGDWSIIEQIIKDEITVDVFIYDLPKKL